MEDVWDHPDMPGSITVGSFGAASVDDGDWNINTVTDENGNEVYTEGK